MRIDIGAINKQLDQYDCEVRVTSKLKGETIKCDMLTAIDGFSFSFSSYEDYRGGSQLIQITIGTTTHQFYYKSSTCVAILYFEALRKGLI
jgi:hypothetical protein